MEVCTNLYKLNSKGATAQTPNKAVPAQARNRSPPIYCKYMNADTHSPRPNIPIKQTPTPNINSPNIHITNAHRVQLNKQMVQVLNDK